MLDRLASPLASIALAARRAKALTCLATLAMTPVLGLAACAQEDAAADDAGWAWSVDTSASAISFAGELYGDAFEGAFETWTAEILFDPDDPAAARIVATIDTTSATSGHRTANDSVRTDSWLDAEAFPEAVFEASAVRSTGPGVYEADGTLTLKEITQPVTLPFTLTIEDGAARAEGALALDRRAFEIGTDDSENDDAVTPDITVSVVVAATRAP